MSSKFISFPSENKGDARVVLGSVAGCYSVATQQNNGMHASRDTRSGSLCSDTLTHDRVIPSVIRLRQNKW